MNKREKSTPLLKPDNLPVKVYENNEPQMNQEVPIYPEQIVEDYDNLQLETYPLNLLFFLKKVDDEEIIESMNQCVRYIFESQQKQKMRLVYYMFAEDWVIKQLPESFFFNPYTKFKKWPIEESIIRTEDKQAEQYNIDYVITIGGDGTILTLLRQLQDYERQRVIPPIITFSQGSLNYLGNFDVKEFKSVLDSTVVRNSTYDKISIDARMRLLLSLHKQQHSSDPQVNVKSEIEDEKIIPNTISSTRDGQSIEFQSLNEITIMRNNENMAQIEIFVNDVLLTIVQGDGILIATPTGSTAYNLSCGGSIVHYSAQVICVTPIAPHSLSFRPIILPAHVEIKIKVPSSARTSSKVTIDGHTKLDLHPEDFMIIKKSPFNVPCNLLHLQLITVMILVVRWSSENQDKLWSTRLHKSLKWNKHIVQKPLKKLVVIKAKL